MFSVSRKRRRMLAALLAAFCLMAVIPVPVAADSSSCDSFRTSSGSGCVWWGVRCAVEDPQSFREITGQWW